MPIIARDPRDPGMDKRLAEARDILEDIDRSNLSTWESGFIESIEDKWLPEGRISETQIEKLRIIGGDEDEFDQRRGNDY